MITNDMKYPQNVGDIFRFECFYEFKPVFCDFFK